MYLLITGLVEVDIDNPRSDLSEVDDFGLLSSNDDHAFAFSCQTA